MITAKLDYTKRRLSQADLDEIHLDRGAHGIREEGLCVMEAAAWLAGESHTDRPRCVCPMIGLLLRILNDSLPDDTRDILLKPLLPVVLNSQVTTVLLSERRCLLCADWLIRTATPVFLASVGKEPLQELAEQLRSLPTPGDWEELRLALPILEKACRELPPRDPWQDNCADKILGVSGWIAAMEVVWCSFAYQQYREVTDTAARVVYRAIQTDSQVISPVYREVIEHLQASAVDLVRRMCAVR